MFSRSPLSLSFARRVTTRCSPIFRSAFIPLLFICSRWMRAQKRSNGTLYCVGGVVDRHTRANVLPCRVLSDESFKLLLKHFPFVLCYLRLDLWGEYVRRNTVRSGKCKRIYGCPLKRYMQIKCLYVIWKLSIRQLCVISLIVCDTLAVGAICMKLCVKLASVDRIKLLHFKM